METEGAVYIIVALDKLDNPGPTASEVAAKSARLRAILKRQE